MTLNHYPLISRKVPGSCADPDGTANPFAPVTCPKCRARLAFKVNADSRTALATRGQESRFFAASSANIARILAN